MAPPLAGMTTVISVFSIHMVHHAANDMSLPLCTQAAETRAREAEEEVDRAEQDAASARAETRGRIGVDGSGNANSLHESSANRAAAAEQYASMLATQLQVQLLHVLQLLQLGNCKSIWLLAMPYPMALVY